MAEIIGSSVVPCEILARTKLALLLSLASCRHSQSVRILVACDLGTEAHVKILMRHLMYLLPDSFNEWVPEVHKWSLVDHKIRGTGKN
jgi:hypothetical protein